MSGHHAHILGAAQIHVIMLDWVLLVSSLVLPRSSAVEAFHDLCLQGMHMKLRLLPLTLPMSLELNSVYTVFHAWYAWPSCNKLQM